MGSILAARAARHLLINSNTQRRNTLTRKKGSDRVDVKMVNIDVTHTELKMKETTLAHL